MLMMKRTVLLTCLIFFCVSFHSRALADEYYKTGEFRAIDEKDGLTSKNISCLALNAKEKILFIGTADDGVFIYDTKEPESEEVSIRDSKKRARAYLQMPVLPSNSVLSMRYDEKNEVLAVGTNSGLAIVQKPVASNMGAVKVISTADFRVPSNTIFSLFIDGNIIYAGTEHGVYTVDNGRPDKIVTESAPGVELGKVNSIFVDSSLIEKAIYIGADTSFLKTADLMSFENGCKKSQPLKCANYVSEMQTQKLSDSTGESEFKSSCLALLSLDGITMMPENGRVISVSAEDGLPENWLTCFASDELDKIQPETDESKIKRGILKKGLWVGTRNSGVCVYNGNKFVVFNKDNSPVASNHITDVRPDERCVYVASGGGLFKYELREPPKDEKAIEQIFVGKVNALKVSGETLYIAAFEGLYSYTLGRKPVKMFPEDPDLRDANALCVSDRGVIFLATKKSGIIAIDGRNLIKLDKDRSALPSNNCMAICGIGGDSVIAGFGDIQGQVSAKCVIIDRDYNVQKFEPLPDDNPTAYDQTPAESRAAVTAFLPVKEGIFVGLGFGDQKSLVFYSGRDWNYYEIKGYNFNYVNSINKMPGDEIAVAGQTVDAKGIVVSAQGLSAWKHIEFLGKSRIHECVCGVKDSSEGGFWIYTRHLSPASLAYSLLCFEDAGSSYSINVKGVGTSFAQINRYAFCGNSNGVMKMLKAPPVFR